MLKQALILSFFLLSLASATSKYFTIDQHFEISEIPSEIADFALNDPKSLAFIQYRNDLEATGWIYYYFKAKSSNPDWLQTYLSGYMEGYAGYNFIWDNYVNSLRYFSDVSDEVTEFIHNQTTWIHQQIQNNPEDNYWNLVNSSFAQLYGMYDGYQVGIKAFHHPEMNLTFDQFYLVTYLMDFFDVQASFQGYNARPPKCSFLARMTNESLYVSHTTWFDYTGLLRIYKVLDLDLANPLVKTKRVSFSSQPGYATSQDDFYILDNGRFVAETSLSSSNSDVYSYIHYDSVPYWIRITVANWAFDTQQTWTDTYFKARSGTYNNQWLVIDFNKFNESKSDRSQAKDIIWIVEEFYSLTSAQDVTQELLIPQGYVGSYNVPYSPAIQNLSQNSNNYTDDTRYHLFKKYAPGIQDIEQFKFVMRLDNVSDTGDICAAIAPRCDLSEDTDPSDFPSGAIDCKVTDETMVLNHQAWIQSGPTHENLPPFNWEHWPQFSNARLGMPDVYDFDWVLMDPNRNYSVEGTHHGKLASEGYYAFIMEGNLMKEDY